MSNPILNYFDASRLYFTSYGNAVYLPKVDKKLKYNSEEHNYQVTVPAHRVDEAGNVYDPERLNDKEGNPLGDVIPSSIKTFPAINRIDHENSGIIRYFDARGKARVTSLPGLTPVTKSPSLLAVTLGSKIPVESVIYDQNGRVTDEEWDPSELSSEYYVDPEDTTKASRSRRREIAKTCVTNTDDKGVPLFLYHTNTAFRKYVNGELARLFRELSSNSLPVLSPSDGPRRPSQLGSYLGSLLVAAFHSKDHPEFLEERRNSVKKGRVDASTAPSVPHLDKDTRFLSHQVYAAAFLKDKKSALLDADPGAGKTLMMLADMLHKMDTGEVRRPCIVMPNPLLGQQKRELEAWTNNTVNFIVLNTATVSRMDPNAKEGTRGNNKTILKNGNHEAGLVEAIKLVNSAPRNTIILTSYAWLRGYPRGIEVPPFPRPNILIDDMGVDMLSLDESHFVRYNSKGEISMRAQAVMQMAPMVEYKRCYSGSIAPNTPEDIFLQTAFLDPSIFGTIDNFRSRYGKFFNDRSHKVEVWKPGAVKKIREELGKTIGLSIRRSAWLNELPELVTHHHFVALDNFQERVYEHILDWADSDSILSKLRADPRTVAQGLVATLRRFVDDHPEFSDSEVMRVIRENNIPDTFTVYDKMGDALPDEKHRRMVDLIRGASDFDQLIELAYTYQSEQEVAYDNKINDGTLEPVDSPALLAKYQAFEIFLGAPSEDPMGSQMLTGASRISPKVSAIDAILDAHFSDPDSGKVLIFSNTKVVAHHIHNHLQRSSEALYYEAAEQQALDRFKADPKIKILVAVVNSLTEGHNLQMANRIIHADLPWMPGSYDQSVARAYRLPPRGGGVSYPTVHVDILLTNRTFEVTKHARLVSKMMMTKMLTSSFDSTTDLPLVSMHPREIARLNEESKTTAYRRVFDDIRDIDRQESKIAALKFKTEPKSLTTGKLLSGSEHIVVPYTDADIRRSPRMEGPTTDRMGVLDPEIMFLNFGWWLAIDYGTPVSVLTKGINGALLINRYFPKTMAREFSNIKDYNEIVSELDSGTPPVNISNLQTLNAQVSGKAPLHVNFPTARIKYAGVVRTGAVKLRPVDRATTSQILRSGLPDDASLRQMSAMLSEVSEGEEVSPLQVVFAVSYLNATKQKIPKKEEDRHEFLSLLYTQSKTLPIRTRKALLSLVPPSFSFSAPPSPPEPPSVDVSVPADAPASPSVPPSASSVDGLTMEPSSKVVTKDGNLFVDLELISLGSGPPASPAGRSNYLAFSGKNADASSALTSFGFSEIPSLSGKVLFFLGEASAAVKKSLDDFSRRIYPNGYSLKDLDAYIETLKKYGMSEDEVSSIFGSETSSRLVDLDVDKDNEDDYDDNGLSEIAKELEADDENLSLPEAPMIPAISEKPPGEDALSEKNRIPSFSDEELGAMIPKMSSYEELTRKIFSDD